MNGYEQLQHNLWRCRHYIGLHSQISVQGLVRGPPEGAASRPAGSDAPKELSQTRGPVETLSRPHALEFSPELFGCGGGEPSQG
jgi:hypothetical protein